VDIIKKVTKDAERLLKTLRAKYYIELPSGEQIWHDLDGYELRESEAEEKPARKKRSNRTGLPFGALVAYYKPYLEKCQNVGDVVEIPFGSFDPEYLRGAVAAHCTTTWGKGTYTSVMNRTTQHVEVMRMASATAPKRKAKTEAATKMNGNGHSKFHSVGHGMDALKNLQFDDGETARQ
jgi:hypothetical protein